MNSGSPTDPYSSNSIKKPSQEMRRYKTDHMKKKNFKFQKNCFCSSNNSLYNHFAISSKTLKVSRAVFSQENFLTCSYPSLTISPFNFRSAQTSLIFSSMSSTFCGSTYSEVLSDPK